MGGKIVKDRLDYELFLKATGEACARTGWRIHAWVLLGNHFHWLLETPAANLISGMKWFLGACSQRFNARHGQRGHVFQGRYKAVVVEADAGDYFETVSTYIHLNPARAGLLKDADLGLRSYPWSSFVQYLQTGKVRPVWLSVERVLGNLSLRDDPRGRQQYAQYMEGRVRALRTAAGRRDSKRQWKALRSGWYVGSAEFRETLLAKVKERIAGHDRSSYGGGATRPHDESEAERLVQRGLRTLGLTDEALSRLPKGHAHKCALARVVHSRTMASHKWLAARLHMGHPQNLTAYIKQAPAVAQPSMELLAAAAATAGDT